MLYILSASYPHEIFRYFNVLPRYAATKSVVICSQQVLHFEDIPRNLTPSGGITKWDVALQFNFLDLNRMVCVELICRYGMENV